MITQAEFLEHLNLNLEKEDKKYLHLAGEHEPDIEIRQYIYVLTNKLVKFKQKKLIKNPEIKENNVNKTLKLLKESSKLLKNQDDFEDIESLVNKEPIIQFVSLLFQEAVAKNASDIHIEPFEDNITIRIRIDGILHDYPAPERLFYDAIVSRIKILSKLDIAQKRLPQDGRYTIEEEDQVIDFRISTVPTLYGESVVIRILNKKKGLIKIEDLGWDKDKKERVTELLSTRQGLILVTGPTGSGKSTTLYAFLQELNNGQSKIITIEDPVEYQIKGINQIQVNPEIDLTFAKGLRSILRQDPDIIMVGEIRDKETSKIAVQSSLTGHLVLSTLHTNDSISALIRMIDLGVENYLLAPSIKIIIAQRLVRKICSNCKVKYTPDKKLRDQFKMGTYKSFYKGKGCKKCDHTGYKGRIAIFEILTITDSLKDAISKNQSEQDIKKLAVKEGLITLHQDAVNKVKKNITTLEELGRVIEQ